MLIVDTREKINKHILDYFDSNNIFYIWKKLDYGDYMLQGSKISIDRKRNLLELSANLGKHHERFRNELLRARDCGARVIVLVEETTPLWQWKSKRTKMTGVQMQKIMKTMSEKYPVEWVQCEPYESGKKIIEILGE